MFCCTDDLSGDEEPDFTSATGINEQLLNDGNDGSEGGKNNTVVANHVFANNSTSWDLYPTAMDPGCDPRWALAAYWPVYVSNFKALVWQEDTWYKQVSNYFAHKRLLTRMIYFHQIEDEIFLQCQKESQMLDMLVYFTSQKDAEKAIKTCHRDSYYGHYLNVFHGRRPDYFSSERTVRLEVSGPTHLTMSDTFVENKLKSFGKVEVAARTTPNHVYVQFSSVQDMVSAVGSQYLWSPSPLKKPVMKQRFIESEVKMGIEWAIQSNDYFMDMQPSADVVKCILGGFRLNVKTNWKGHKAPKKSDFSKSRLKQSRERMKMLAKQSRKDITMNKSKLRKAALKLFHNPDAEIPGLVSVTPAASDTMSPMLDRTPRPKISDALKGVNWFLRIHGKPPVSKAIINARLMEKSKKTT